MLLNQHRLGRELPDPYCTIASAIRNGEADRNAPMYQQVDVPHEGDAILLRHKGFPIHVGYCIDATYMLHTEIDQGSLVERWNGIRWENRVMGVYRYAPDRI